MRNLIKILLAILLGFNGILTVGAKEYADVKSGEEFYEAIEYASDNNIVSGYSDGTFRAYEGVTRAEFTKMLINFKYTQEEINGCKGNSFPDVAGSYVHTKYICVAKKEGILNGYSDGTFKPEQKITTPEGIKIISNTYGYTEGNSDNFDKYFEALETRSALPEASMWWPEEMWRGEVMEILYRLEESLTDREAITYNQYKEHQEWKEVVLEDAGIKFSVPSWFEEKEKFLAGNPIEINNDTYILFRIDYPPFVSDDYYTYNSYEIFEGNNTGWCQYELEPEKYLTLKVINKMGYESGGHECQELVTVIENDKEFAISHYLRVNREMNQPNIPLANKLEENLRGIIKDVFISFSTI